MTWKCQNRFIKRLLHAVISISNILRNVHGKLSLYQCINIQLNCIFNIIKIIELFGVDLYKVLGCGVFAVGIWMQANRDSFSVVLPSHSFLTAASLVIIAGAITLVIGFVGCCGAIAENKCMMVVVSFVSIFFFLYHKCVLLTVDVCNCSFVRIWGNNVKK